MGRGIIKSGGDDGLYNVELALHKDRVNDTIAIINNQIAVLTTKINAMEEGSEKDLEKLKRASYRKRKDYLNDNMPEDPTVSAWCGDLTEDLSGNVGTIEIPGERGIVQIQPGHEDNAAYNTERDGQLQPAIANTPAGTFYNLAMLPGWQKWKPTYRHGIISNIDTDNDTCDVLLDVVESSQQGLTINQESKLVGIPIEYMSCNASAFEDGDHVLVKFEGQEWDGAKVVGFKDNPKACLEQVWVEMRVGDTERCFVWDIEKNKYAKINKNNGDPASFPCDPDDISDWRGKQESVGVGLFSYNYGMSDSDYSGLDDCGRGLFYPPELSCYVGDWGTAGDSSDSAEEPSNCGCEFIDTGECSFVWDLTQECKYPGDSGTVTITGDQNILWEGFSWEARGPKKLIFQNNKEGESQVENAFKIKLQNDEDELHWRKEGAACGKPCDNIRLDSGIYSNTYKFQTPINTLTQPNILEINHARTKNWNVCDDSGAYAEENYLVAARLNPRGAFSDKTIAQIYTVETRTVSRDMPGAVDDFGDCCGTCVWQNIIYATNGLNIAAQVGLFTGDAYPDGTKGVDPTGLPRNEDFETSISDMYDILRIEEEIPEADVALISLTLLILQR